MVTSKSYKTKFLDKKKIAKDTYTFYFEKPQRFNFKSGQYNKWKINIKNPDDRGSSRYFTIATNPLEKKFINITTKIIKSSFKRELLNLKKGDEVTFFGPIGYFLLEEKDQRPKFFISGGIGITPFYSMIEYVSSKKLRNNITLLASFSKKEDVIFFEELKENEEKLKNLKIVYSLSKENVLGFERGRITEEMIKKYTDIKKSVFYVVGPPQMVISLEKTLKNMGIEEHRLRLEEFSGY